MNAERYSVQTDKCTMNIVISSPLTFLTHLFTQCSAFTGNRSKSGISFSFLKTSLKHSCLLLKLPLNYRLSSQGCAQFTIGTSAMSGISHFLVIDLQETSPIHRNEYKLENGSLVISKILFGYIPTRDLTRSP